MLLQIPALPPGAIENWLIPAAAVASMALLAKKLFGKKVGPISQVGPVSPSGPPDFITRAELHHELNTVRDKIDARFLTLTEKIEHLGTGIHEKLTAVESALARVDERTKK